MKVDEGAGRASTRQRQTKVRALDDHARQELKRKRLDALEQDNWHEDALEPDDDDYEPNESDDGELFLGEQKKGRKKSAGKGAKKKTRGGDQFREETGRTKSFDDIVDDEQYHKFPSWVPTYLSAAVKPSTRPPRKFCYLTGLAGKYKCPVTGDYLGSLEAYETHKETRLKGMV
ncbi:hypothetical protein KFE25_000359 [Diacronema lutheri]|nr:hypothetical protein KFE25_000359 [Diacronema lutheri]